MEKKNDASDKPKEYKEPEFSERFRLVPECQKDFSHGLIPAQVCVLMQAGVGLHLLIYIQSYISLVHSCHQLGTYPSADQPPGPVRLCPCARPQGRKGGRAW